MSEQGDTGQGQPSPPATGGMSFRIQSERRISGSYLHDLACPLCERIWDGLESDMERLAHLIVCAAGR